MSWHQWDSALGWIWDGRCEYQSSPCWESSLSCPLLIPVHRLQNLFSLSPLFCKQGPEEGAVPRGKVRNNNVTLPSFQYPDKTNWCLVKASLSLAVWLPGPACVWDFDFSFLRVALCTSLYWISSCWFLQFGKIISNSDLILQSACSLSKPGVICKFYNSTFYFII